VDALAATSRGRGEIYVRERRRQWVRAERDPAASDGSVPGLVARTCGQPRDAMKEGLV
jgi:hypothetical protein